MFSFAHLFDIRDVLEADWFMKMFECSVLHTVSGIDPQAARLKSTNSRACPNARAISESKDCGYPLFVLLFLSRPR
jgi:hypothetical protein